MKIGYGERMTNFVAMFTSGYEVTMKFKIIECNYPRSSTVFFMICLHRVFILVMGNYIKIALCHNKLFWRVTLNNSVPLVVHGLYSICPWFSESGSNQALNGFQHWLPVASSTIAKTLWAPSALTVLGLWPQQCDKRQDYKEYNDHKRPRETKRWKKPGCDVCDSWTPRLT